MQINMKSSDIMNLRKFYRRAPGKFTVVMANMMTSFAFGTRAVALNIIRKRMVVRNSRFVDSRMRVTKARVGKLYSEVGSIYSDRFTGWEEQETGKPTQRTRIFGIMARYGDIRRQTMAQSRLKPSANHITPDQFQGRTERFKTTAMIMSLKRQKTSRPFVVRKHSRLKAGLYRFLRGRIQMLQHFKTVRQPKRVKWMEGAEKLYMKGNRVRNEWAKSIRHVLKFK